MYLNRTKGRLFSYQRSPDSSVGAGALSAATEMARGADSPHFAVPFIIGAPRSGTTLLRFMLDSHSQLAIPPETGFITALRAGESVIHSAESFLQLLTGFPEDSPAWPDYGLDRDILRSTLRHIEPFSVREGLRTFYTLYAKRLGKPRWGDKTPIYAFFTKEIMDFLPEARILHIIRDGRDIACSIRKLWFRPGDTMTELAKDWASYIVSARKNLGRSTSAMEVRFETLVRSPEENLKRICAFLDLSFEPEMLRYYQRAPDRLNEHRSRYRRDGSILISQQDRRKAQNMVEKPPAAEKIFAWKQELTAQEVAEFEAVAGDVLSELGYELTTRRWV